MRLGIGTPAWCTLVLDSVGNTYLQSDVEAILPFHCWDNYHFLAFLGTVVMIDLGISLWLLIVFMAVQNVLFTSFLSSTLQIHRNVRRDEDHSLADRTGSLAPCELPRYAGCFKERKHPNLRRTDRCCVL